MTEVLCTLQLIRLRLEIPVVQPSKDLLRLIVADNDLLAIEAKHQRMLWIAAHVDLLQTIHVVHVLVD